MQATTNFTTTPLSAILLSFLGACDPAHATDEEPTEDVELRCAFCCTSCGVGNGPIANGYPMSTLKLDGTLGPGNIRIAGVRSPGWGPMHTLDVIDDEFVARASPGGAIVAMGVNMVGWTIVIRTASNSEFYVLIKAYDNSVPAWTNSGGFHTVYSLGYIGALVKPKPNNLCGGPLTEPNATLIAGETYDTETMTVNPNQPGWFTIACAGQAVGKMKMFNFGPNDSVDGQGPATWQERQATLKMLSADYCGDGTSHTESGLLVSWANSHGTIDPGEPEPSLMHEALWDEHGAICLDEPRLWNRGDVACAAVLPTCDQIASVDWTWDTASLGGN